MTKTFSEKVFAVVDRIPSGKVSTYGNIARMIGSPRSARYVGFALRSNTQPGVTPCHRVVFKDGCICEGYAFGGPEVQRELLEAEGIAFLDDMHVNMEKHLWHPQITDEAFKEALPGPPPDINWTEELGE